MNDETYWELWLKDEKAWEHAHTFTSYKNAKMVYDYYLENKPNTMVRLVRLELCRCVVIEDLRGNVYDS